MKNLIILFSFLFGASHSMAIEEPRFVLVSKSNEYEVRLYGPILVAETQIDAKFEDAGNKAFRILANFIFGDNKTKVKISMTAPVNQQAVTESEKIKMTAPVNQIQNSTGFLVQFTMPKEYTLETVPKPNDPRVQLRLLSPRTVAVYTYSGSWSEERYKEKLEDFKTALKNDGVTLLSEPTLARYNSPFQLWFLRRNEIWIDIKPVK